MDKAMKEELKSLGFVLIWIVVAPSVLAAIIIGSMFLWLPLGLIITAVVIVAAFTGSIRSGAARRRKWDRP